ncbi:hypothetical protein NONO_c17120 [Nocardia nova SH22a]|uniref:Uncharacterized protein n=1 Tax=Nocardia nova SH22a TaxID=1415166 RepID=W5TC18_9NOCA|nr:hypothetical protein [Nocardia nova]AHH16513.1 hypothetical protein NONO_c17120 [Nocardia nova SH22a]
MKYPSRRTRVLGAAVATAFVIAAFTTGCTAVTAQAHPAASVHNATPAIVAAQRISPDDLAQQMQQAVENAEPGSEVGIDVVDTASGATLAGLDTDQQFYTASVVKLLIALDTMRSAGWQPDSETTATLSTMLSASDDDIADALWDDDGGPQIVSRMAATIGLPDTTPPDDPEQWGETRTTPADVVRIYDYITTDVPSPARDIVLTALGGTTEIAADGTDQYFGIPDGLPGTGWDVKQGWMTLDDSTTIDTTGLVSAGAQSGRYVVVVLTTQPPGIDWTAGGAAVTAAVGALRPALVPNTSAGTVSAETVTCSSICPASGK